jgi:hypothetical protein
MKNTLVLLIIAGLMGCVEDMSSDVTTAPDSTPVNSESTDGAASPQADGAGDNPEEEPVDGQASDTKSSALDNRSL